MKKDSKQISDRKNPSAVIQDLAKENAEGGSITLDELMKRCPGYDRQEMYGQLKLLHGQHGVLVQGRRGHPTRFYFGPSSKDVGSKMHLRKIRLGSPVNGRRSNADAHVEQSTGAGNPMALRIKIGGQTQTIPIEFELVPA